MKGTLMYEAVAMKRAADLLPNDIIKVEKEMCIVLSQRKAATKTVFVSYRRADQVEPARVFRPKNDELIMTYEFK